MTTLDQLKERLDKIYKSPPYSRDALIDVCYDAIKLCEAYRKVGASEGHVCHDLICKPECHFFEEIDEKADRLFEGVK